PTERGGREFGLSVAVDVLSARWVVRHLLVGHGAVARRPRLAEALVARTGAPLQERRAQAANDVREAAVAEVEEVTARRVPQLPRCGVAPEPVDRAGARAFD